MSHPAPAESPADTAVSDTSELNTLVSGLGYEIVDVAGFLDDVHELADEQLETLGQAQAGMHSLKSSSEAVVGAVDRVSASSSSALSAVEQSVETVRASATQSRTVSTWVTDFEGRISGMEACIKDVSTSNDEITSIAMQVNILAINASIEAARAGDAGRGFAVVASAINELSKHTSNSAKMIADQISTLDQTIKTLKDQSQDISRDAQHVLETSSDTDTALGEIASTIRQTTEDTQVLTQQAALIEEASTMFAPTFDKLSRIVRQTTDGVTQAHERTTALIDRSEAIVQQTASLGGTSVDRPFIAFVQNAADRIGDMWQNAVSTGRISMGDLFDKNYSPIPNSNPAQVVTRFTEFADATLPEIQEAALDIDRKVVFCAAVDTSGYLPTHNKKFSHPQGEDPVWNASHSRNRRIFNDRVGLKSGTNTKAFLLQVYRRDMGGGKFVMMKDLSAPIFVNGKHWGGLRMAYTFT